jgi:hypothetical protein
VPSPNGKEIAIVSRGEILLPMPMVEVPKNYQHTRARAPRNGHQTINPFLRFRRGESWDLLPQK